MCRRGIGCGCGKVLGILAIRVVGSDESFVEIFVLVLVKGVLIKLRLNTLEAPRSVRVTALRLCKFLQTLYLSTHCTFDLDHLLTSAGLAVDGFVHFA